MNNDKDYITKQPLLILTTTNYKLYFESFSSNYLNSPRIYGRCIDKFGTEYWEPVFDYYGNSHNNRRCVRDFLEEYIKEIWSNK